MSLTAKESYITIKYIKIIFTKLVFFSIAIMHCLLNIVISFEDTKMNPTFSHMQTWRSLYYAPWNPQSIGVRLISAHLCKYATSKCYGTYHILSLNFGRFDESVSLNRSKKASFLYLNYTINNPFGSFLSTSSEWRVILGVL